MELARYERDNPGYVRTHWDKHVIRPFLTPTSGVDFEDGKDEAELPHTDFTEIIRKTGPLRNGPTAPAKAKRNP